MTSLLYIAGPMTGVEGYNIPAFKEAEARLRAHGYRVLSPAHTAEEFGTEQPYSFYLKQGLRRLLKCDGVALLHGWPKSKGASLELQVARAIGLDARMVEGWL